MKLLALASASMDSYLSPTIENGVPIPHFFDDPTDEALLNLACFLDALLDVTDVRSIISIRLL